MASSTFQSCNMCPVEQIKRICNDHLSAEQRQLLLALNPSAEREEESKWKEKAKRSLN